MRRLKAQAFDQMMKLLVRTPAFQHNLVLMQNPGDLEAIRVGPVAAFLPPNEIPPLTSFGLQPLGLCRYFGG